MDIEVRVLIVEKGLETGASLVAALFPELVVTGFEVRRGLHLAFQELRESDFDLCFVSEDFPDQEISDFFKDLRQISRSNESLFVKLMRMFPEGFKPEQVKEQGFHLAVRRPPTDGDKALLRAEVKKFIDEREIVRKCIDVDLAVKLILREIDRVAVDRKRGIDRKFARNIVSDFMNDQVHSHEDVMKALVDALSKHAEDSRPDKDVKVVLPEYLFEKDMPGLVDGTYQGVSQRVWEMLKDKFGVSGEGETNIEVHSEEGSEAEDHETNPEEEDTEELRDAAGDLISPRRSGTPE